MVAEGYLPTMEGLAWRAAPAGEVTPSPQAGEKVYLKDQLVRGVSLPISHFFLSVLNHFKVQPHNLSPNSILVLSNFVTLCEGYLGIRPRLDLFVYFFTVKREDRHIREELRNCGTISFKIRPGRRFPTSSATSHAKTGSGRTSMAPTFLWRAEKQRTRTWWMEPPPKSPHGGLMPPFPPTSTLLA